MKTFDKVNLERCVGTWFEIAWFAHFIEKGLVGVSATYSLKKNGNVGIINQSFKNSLTGKLRWTKGFAKLPDPNIPRRLIVYFLCPFGGVYLILDLDNDYQCVLVGSSSKKYLGILCRTKTMDDSIYNNLVKKAESLGFDTSRLKSVPQ